MCRKEAPNRTTWCEDFGQGVSWGGGPGFRNGLAARPKVEIKVSGRDEGWAQQTRTGATISRQEQKSKKCTRKKKCEEDKQSSAKHDLELWRSPETRSATTVSGGGQQGTGEEKASKMQANTAYE